MIPYTLAKDMRSNGFKFRLADHPKGQVFTFDEDTYVYEEPFLEEVIEALGDDFRWLKKRGHASDTIWLAQGRQHPVTKDIKTYGSTPLIAACNLWLRLNPKDDKKVKLNELMPDIFPNK